MQCKTHEWVAQVPRSFRPPVARCGYPAPVDLLRLRLGLIALRVRGGERGQSAVEFIGVLALVALIVLALTQSELLSSARGAITDAIADLFTAAS